MMLAGYAEITNRGRSLRRVASVSAPGFAAVELHATIIEDGVAHMKRIGELTLAAGERTSLTPGGRHFMLIRPATVPRAGDTVEITLVDDSGCSSVVPFQVLADAPAARSPTGSPHAPASPAASVAPAPPAAHSHH